LSDSQELNQTASRFMTKRIPCMHGRPHNVFQEATSKFCLTFTGYWRCNANGRSQNALPFLPHSSVLVNLQFSIFCL